MDIDERIREAEKSTCLHDEIKTAHRLIVNGLGDLQEIDLENNFYYLPQQLLSIGIERLIKCYICLVYHARHGEYPDNKFIKDIGHDLIELLNSLCADYFNPNNIPALEEDYKYLKEDKVLDEIIKILSDFGKFARYYNLDVITGRNKQLIDPKSKWNKLERNIESILPNLERIDMNSLKNDYYPPINSVIIEKIEKLVRAIIRQFTIGGHGEILRLYYQPFSSLLVLADEKLGTTDYRRSVFNNNKRKVKWVKRSERSIKKSCWPTLKINRIQFEGKWPFRSESVIIECRDKIFCIVNIDSYDFALNGSAATRYGLPFPHQEGVTYLDISIGPFLDMAFALGKNQKQ